ncbi:hypothetical protein PCK1_000932 [Pneumocystis canis]|nr:hypothetical protein PCK1_000932 [Pneumocystis canis]
MNINNEMDEKNYQEKQLQQLIERLEMITLRLEKTFNSEYNMDELYENSENKKNETYSNERPYLELKDVLEPSINEYLSLSQKLDGIIYQQAIAVSNAFSILYRFMVDDSILLQELETSLNQITILKEEGRGTHFLNHLSMVSEGAASLGWVIVGSTAAGYIQDMKDSAQFYADRVLKEKNIAYTTWVHAYIKLLSDLQEYVKKNYPRGFFRNSTESVSQHKNDCIKMIVLKVQTNLISAIKIASSDASLPQIESPAPISIESVFAELNMGESITSRLRKVDKNQPVSRNVSSESMSVFVSKDSLHHNTIVNEKKVKLPCRKTLIGSRWTIENFENNSNIVIDQLELNQIIHIFNCKTCTIYLKGKANAVYMDQTVNCGLMIDTLISSIEFTRCTSLTLQILDYTPTITLDQCDNCQIYLSSNCLNTEIITSKYNTINVHIPDEGNEGDYKECPIPEMFKSTIVGGKLITSFVNYAC